MSLGIAFKGPEGIVLAADSRVTLTAQRQQGNNQQLMPAYYDNATKLLQVKGQNYVGAVTFGLGSIGQPEPRTAHSFVPEFEAELLNEARLTVEEFARRLGQFYLGRWNALGMPPAAQWTDAPMIFLIGGYDGGAAYGRVFELNVPHHPDPTELNGGVGNFGMNWGGQTEYADRLMQGFDSRIPAAIVQQLGLDPKQIQGLQDFLKQNFASPIPWQFLPLQDCVDLAIFLIRTTITLQNWVVDIRGVGGAVDVATITPIEGFRSIQQKTIRGER